MVCEHASEAGMMKCVGYELGEGIVDSVVSLMGTVYKKMVS